MYSPLYATIIDASGTSRITDSGELPEGRYYVEVYYENCYVPEGGTYPEMVCDEYASEVLAGAEIIKQIPDLLWVMDVGNQPVQVVDFLLLMVTGHGISSVNKFPGRRR